jgi:hypothetical protein
MRQQTVFVFLFKISFMLIKEVCETSFHLIENIFSSGVSLAYTGHPAVDGLPAVHELDRHFAEEEVNVLAHVVAADEVRLVEHVGVVPVMKVQHLSQVTDETFSKVAN